jgi:iron-sulfur cluster assembly protein
MALDESHDDDEVFTDRGIKYVVSKSLLDQVKPITVDYITSPRGSGFKLTSSMDAMRTCTPSCSC